jgi:hypothetical protein
MSDFIKYFFKEEKLHQNGKNKFKKGNNSLPKNNLSH